MGLKGSDLMSWLQISLDKLKVQKARRASRTSLDGSGNHRWESLNVMVSLLYLLIKIEFRFVVYT